MLGAFCEPIPLHGTHNHWLLDVTMDTDSHTPTATVAMGLAEST